MQPRNKSSKTWLWVLGILGLVVLICGGGFAGFFVYMASIANTNTVANNSKWSTNSSTRSNSNTTKNTSPSPDTSAKVQQIDLGSLIKESATLYGFTEFTDGELLMASKEKGYYYVLVTPDDYKTDGAQTRVTVRNPDDADSDLGYGLIFHSDTKPL